MQKSEKEFLRKFVRLILIFTLSLIGIFVLDRFTLFFDSNKVLFPVSFNIFSIDIIGAFIPFCVGLMAEGLYVRQKFPVTLYFLCLSISILIAFFTGQVVENKGLMSYPALFSCLISLMVVSCFFLFMCLKEKTVWHFNKRYYHASLFVVISCSPLSKIAIDLFYLYRFSNPTIGGNGLADGVFLSILYAPLTSTLITSVLSVILLIGSYFRAKKSNDPGTNQNPLALK